MELWQLVNLSIFLLLRRNDFISLSFISNLFYLYILALQFRMMRAGIPLPKGCLLIYPALQVDENSCSPSGFASLDDPVLPTAILKECARAYLGNEFKNLDDPCISPLNACDEFLKGLPPIRMVVGSKDPLHDDSWRFLAKMRYDL